MYLYGNNERDSALDRSIIIHEYMHGVSNRLTGGKRDGRCLSRTDSRALGEAWSDVLAWLLAIVRSDTPNDDKPLATFATGDSDRGIRMYPYSTSKFRNPLHYGYINYWIRKNQYAIHNAGSIYAEMMFEVYWEMWRIHQTFGWIGRPGDNAVNNFFLRYLIQGLKLQSCNPTFEDARNAFLRADQQIGNGFFRCAIWRGFAKRGLGSLSKTIIEGNYFSHIPDYSIPDGVCRTPLDPSELVYELPNQLAGASDLKPQKLGNEPIALPVASKGVAMTSASASTTRAVTTATASAAPLGKPSIGLRNGPSIAAAMAAIAAAVAFAAFF